MSAMVGRTPAALFALALCASVAGCVDVRESGQTSAAQWRDAQRAWTERRDPLAYRAWREIDAASPEGREARRLLSEADDLYRDGIARVEADDDGVRDAFGRALLLAPMDPRLYLPLARAFRARADEQPDNPHYFIRAAQYYRNFLVLEPLDPACAAARAELEELDPGSELPAPMLDPAPQPSAQQEPASPVAAWLASVAVLLALTALLLIALRSRRARRSLEDLAAERPELHPAIAYLVASLRHELLKHRIGAVGSAVEALASGRASLPEREFVSGRLFGGEPIDVAWDGHLAAFERALGSDLDLRRGDRAFRRADRAIRTLATLAPRISRGEPRAMVRLQAAHAELRALDTRLAALASRLVRSRVDAALVDEVFAELRGEYAAGRVELAAFERSVPDPAPEVEVFRVDLVLVLKNVLRNALLAVGRSSEGRPRVRVDVDTELQPTGEEQVVVRVHDTATETLSTEAIYERRVDRGLGLVTAALRRYDGVITVEPGAAGYEKALALRFFRVFGDADGAPSDTPDADARHRGSPTLESGEHERPRRVAGE